MATNVVIQNSGDMPYQAARAVGSGAIVATDKLVTDNYELQSRVLALYLGHKGTQKGLCCQLS